MNTTSFILFKNSLLYTRIRNTSLCYLICLIGFLSISSNLQSQGEQEIRIQIEPMYGSKPLELNQTYFLPTGDSLQFSRLRFYLSNFQLLDSNQIAFQESNSFHLIDIEEKNSLKILLIFSNKKKYNQLSFSVGVDSITNSGGVMGGDLDPTKGMYWTWQSGYINFKLEGTSSICENRFKEFQYHIGGYQAPNNTFQTIVLPINKENNFLKIKLDIKAFISQLDLKSQHSIMMPGSKATQLSELLPSLFELKK
ncbi:MAG: MbnP family protein [Saprospiraceae bacterium]